MESDLDRILAMARRLSAADRQRLLAALSLSAPAAELPMAAAPRPQSAAWVKSERGHAVLITDDAPDAAIPAGAAALAGIWAPGDGERSAPGAAPNLAGYSGPAIVATDVCVDLACGVPEAVGVFQLQGLEVRIATATYLELLAECATDGQRRRVRRFVSPYAVLSLGPVASSQSVELLLEKGSAGLQPLEALIAATAMAHEIPVVTRHADRLAGIDGLDVLVPYG